MLRNVGLIVAIGAACLSLTGCGGSKETAEVRARYQPLNMRDASRIGVNGYLWRATLDTLAFMPLQSADSSGGVINTQWYVNPDVPNERFSITVYIKDKSLRADALQVAVHRQTFDRERGWTDAPTQQKTVDKIQDAILLRARELRLGTVISG